MKNVYTLRDYIGGVFLQRDYVQVYEDTRRLYVYTAIISVHANSPSIHTPKQVTVKIRSA